MRTACYNSSFSFDNFPRTRHFWNRSYEGRLATGKVVDISGVVNQSSKGDLKTGRTLLELDTDAFEGPATPKAFKS